MATSKQQSSNASRKQRRKNMKLSLTKNILNTSERNPEGRRFLTPGLDKPNLTKPNQTKPNQTNPNQTRPNRTKPHQTKPNLT